MTQEQAEYITDALEMIGMNEPKEIVQTVSGFVPVFETLLEKYGDHITALVFGRRWQYCRMKDGVCTASLDTIANDLKLSPATVMRHTEKLVSDGYLIDLTPDLRNTPHTYADAGRVIMKSQLTAESISQRNVSISQRNATVSQSQLIKGINKQNKTLPLSIENAIATNQPVTAEMAERASVQNNAPRQFENALGFSKSLPWWSNKAWTEFAEWVCERYTEDKLAFGEYNIWRNTKYTKGGMTNNRIRGFPLEFIDSWDMFMAAHQKTDELPAAYKPFVSTREGDEYLSENPFKDRRK